MGRNVEIKAHVRDPATLGERIREVAGDAVQTLNQRDVFFHTPRGRLKLRTFPAGHGELIRYERPDRSGPEESRYDLLEVADATLLESLLTAVLDVRGEVRKQRRLYRVGRTRIHLDRVEQLGVFLELEVVLAPDEPREVGEATTRRLMHDLGIEEADLVRGAYIDLLERAGRAVQSE